MADLWRADCSSAGPRHSRAPAVSAVLAPRPETARRSHAITHANTKTKGVGRTEHTCPDRLLLHRDVRGSRLPGHRASRDEHPTPTDISASGKQHPSAWRLRRQRVVLGRDRHADDGRQGRLRRRIQPRVGGELWEPHGHQQPEGGHLHPGFAGDDQASCSKRTRAPSCAARRGATLHRRIA